MIPIHKRKKRIPGAPAPELPKKETMPHELRRQELANLHGIKESDIFVDPKNGVELFRTDKNTWVSNPIYMDDKWADNHWLVKFDRGRLA